MVAEPGLSETGRSIRILLVDGNSAFIRRIAQVLREWEEAVVIGSIDRTEDKMLTQAKVLRPDVILIDLTIPDLSGLHVVTSLRAMLPQTGIVALIALGFDGHGQAVMAAGADTLVSKTAIRTGLLSAIRAAVQNRARCQTGPATEGGGK